MTEDLRVDLDKLSWDPSTVEVPETPAITAAADPMSTMLAAYMPTVTDELKAKIADAAAHEQRFSDNLGAARAAYQSTEDTNHGTISNAENAVARGQSAATGGSGGAGGGSQFGQLISTAMQAASQAAQMPGQALQMAGAIPQMAMQIGQQVQQMAGQSGAGSTGPEGRTADSPVDSSDSADDERDHEPKHARSDDDEAEPSTGKHAAGDVPVHASAPPLPEQSVASAPPRVSGRHAANPAIDM